MNLTGWGATGAIGFDLTLRQMVGDGFREYAAATIVSTNEKYFHGRLSTGGRKTAILPEPTHLTPGEEQVWKILF